MGHNKLPLKVIQCDKRRKSAFSKRIKGLTKKAAELATLCGIDVCMVCCDPNGDPLETWPGSRSEVLPIIERYKKITETGRKGSITDVCSVLEDKIKKLQRDLDRQRAENNKLILYPSQDHQLDGMSEGYLKELLGQLDMKLEKLKGRIEMVKSSSDERRLNMQMEQELVKEDCNAPLPLSYLTPLHHIHTSSQNLYFDSDRVQNEQEHVVEEDCNAPPHLSHLSPFYHLQTNSQNLGFVSDMVQNEQEHVVEEDCNAPLPLSYLTPLHHIHTSSQNLDFDSDMVQNEQEHVVEEDCNAPPHLSHLSPFYHLQTNSQNLGFVSEMVQNEQEHVVEEDCNEPPHLSYLTRFYHLHTYSQNLGIDSDMVGMEQEHVVAEDCGAPLPVSYHTPLFHLHMDSQNLGFNSDMGSEMPMLNGNIMSGNSYDWMVGFQDFKTHECGIEILLPTSNELEYTGFPLLGLEPQDSVGLLNIEQMEYENDTSFQIPNRALGSWNSLASFR